MGVAVLSPCLLFIDPSSTIEEKYKHYYKLEGFIKRLHKHINLNFELYTNAPYIGYKMTIPEYMDATLNNYVMVNIYKPIINMIKKEYVDLSHYQPVKPLDEFFLPSNEDSEAFLSYIRYLADKEAILFIGEKNFDVVRPIKFYGEDAFSINTSTYIAIEQTDILLKYLKNNVNYDNIFPQKQFCSQYNEYLKEKIKMDEMNQSEKMALFINIGDVVAKYNYYEKDNNLINANTSRDKKRIIYKKSKGKLYYLSIDFESGGFEVFDAHYNHLGQYDFSGNKVKKANRNTHRLEH